VSLARSKVSHSWASAYFSAALMSALSALRAPVFFLQLVIGHGLCRLQPEVLDQDVKNPLRNLLLCHLDDHGQHSTLLAVSGGIFCTTTARDRSQLCCKARSIHYDGAMHRRAGNLQPVRGLV
jgi:hypothetical protein